MHDPIPSSKQVFQVERLESRRLLSGGGGGGGGGGNTLSEIALAGGSTPEKVVVGNDGSLYVYEHGSNKLARQRPGKSTFTEFDIPTASNQHFGMAVSRHGDIFYTIENGIGAYSPRRNTIRTIDLGHEVADITRGPDGNLWFTEPDANKIGRLTLIGRHGDANGEVQTYDVPTAFAGLASIVTGPKNDLWFGEDLSGQIGHATLDPAGGAPSIEEFSLPAGANSHAVGITTGSDGNVWFAEVFANKIGKIDENTHAITEFDVPTANSQPFWITPGPDGALWFTERAAGKLGRITTDGAITETDAPAGASAFVTSIVMGRNRTLWFTEANADTLGKLVVGQK